MRLTDLHRPELLTVDLDDCLPVAARRMEQAQVGALAVIAGERSVGIITERDVVRALARETDPAGATVAAYASDPEILMNALVEAGGREDLQRLALRGEGPCVSVFLPTHRAGREVQQGPIKLRKLLRLAGDRLAADGVKATDIARLLDPLHELLDDRLFWHYQSDGLAVFSRPGWWGWFRVPLDLPELAIVDDRFHITPLIPLSTGDGRLFRAGSWPERGPAPEGNP
jgi:CBS domain-containing protein